MALLHAEKLQKNFGERTLFSEVSFDVFQKDHIGLVGVNGCGKTTLTRMLLGLESVDGGVLSVAKGARIASLDQSPVWAEGETLYQAVLHCFDHLRAMERDLAALSERMTAADTVTDAMLRHQAELTDRYEREGGLTYESRTRSALLGLGFTEGELTEEIAHMSGGQMRKAALAKILLSAADLLLLDEPTNHLDIASMEWLEEYLKSYRGAYMVISHDRYFLDAVCGRILELENGSLHTFSGNYSRYAEHKLGEREYALRHYKNGLREIKRLEGVIAQQRRWNQARNYVTIASKEKQIERLKSQLVKPEETPDAIRFSLRAGELTANDVVSCRDLSKSFGEKTLFRYLNLLVKNGERVCLIGANGCGKTTLLKILLGQEQPDEGYYRLGPNVNVGYFSQSTVHTESGARVLDDLADAFPRETPQRLRNLLGTFLFRGDDVYKPLNTLSGGELARVQLLKMMLSGSNVLFLDEPTNHLDIPSCEALENALAEYGGTMLIVTHDRYLTNRIADRVILMDQSGVRAFQGDWDSYKAAIAESGLEEPTADREPAKENEYQRGKDRRAAAARARTALKKAEQAVMEGEAAVAALETELARPEIASDYEAAAGICGELNEKREALERAYGEWERAERESALFTEEQS